MSGLSHLDELEAEAIYIIREVAAECEKPVMLYSIGKDSSVMLHLAMKAFYPEKPVLECPVFHSEDISGHTRAGHCRSTSASALLWQKVRIPDISDR